MLVQDLLNRKPREHARRKARARLAPGQRIVGLAEPVTGDDDAVGREGFTTSGGYTVKVCGFEVVEHLGQNDRVERSLRKTGRHRHCLEADVRTGRAGLAGRLKGRFGRVDRHEFVAPFGQHGREHADRAADFECAPVPGLGQRREGCAVFFAFVGTRPEPPRVELVEIARRDRARAARHAGTSRNDSNWPRKGASVSPVNRNPCGSSSIRSVICDA